MMWQYKVTYNNEEPDLNRLGADGWECFAVVAKGETLKAFFKRHTEVPEQGNSYSYLTMGDGGYVIYGNNDRIIPAHELVKMLND